MGDKKKEKRKIEFFCPSGCLNDTLEINKPEAPLAVKPVAPGLATIHEVAREAGIGAATLRYRLKTSGIDPVERRPVHGGLCLDCFCHDFCKERGI